MSAPADLVLVVDRVHALDEAAPADATVIAIRAGLVVEVGGADLIGRLAGPATTVRRLPGAVATPGYVDAHIHPIGGVSGTRGADLTTCRDLDDVRAALRAELARLGTDDWLLGWGLSADAFGRDAPSHRVLDEVAPDRRAWLSLADAHSGLASRAALEAAGITGARAFEDGSSIAVDADGTPTGWLLEWAAMGPVARLVPEQSTEERVHRLREILTDMARTGFTGGHVMDLEPPDALDLLEELERRGDLPLELRLSPWCTPGVTDEGLTALVAAQGHRGRRWRVEGVKFMIDGTIDGGTAWLFEPDTLGENTDPYWHDPEAYRAAIRFLHDAGVPTATHAIGDRAVDWVVETLATLPAGGPMHRIEHIETVRDESLDALAQAGAAASMQPTHCTHFVRADGADGWSRRLGPERAARGWRTRDAVSRGIPLALGSDWPIAPSDARAISADAQLRRPVDRPGDEPVGADQALTARDVLDGFTRGAHRAIGSDGGRLAPGLPATITVFDRDPLSTPPEEFAGARVLLTLIAGDPVVDAEA